ncbi:hypothetical protein [Limnovirga soli]|uniref:Uncharacterized protein n=1 Tax=Limnovirga soli TaxID=2656915 RepID=A0A8J8FIF9_9BACT|nr:hypothetical protein [Limnovirga soli]NNV57788.1 hypothetical protein [Limnovirga soli]
MKMFSYALLEPGCYYLIQEKENDPITLIQIKVVTDAAMFVVKYQEDIKSEWKKKADAIFDIIELLGDKPASEWRKIYFNNADAFYEEEDDDEEGR